MQIVRQYLSHLRSTGAMSANTVRAYSNDCEHWAAWLAARGCSTHGATADDLARYLHDLGAAGVRPTTRARRLVSLRGLHRWAKRSGLAASDPTRTADAPRFRRRVRAVLSPEQVAAILATCDNSWFGLRDRALIELTYSAGLRCSEVLGVNLSHLSLAESEGEVHVTGKGSIEAAVPFGASAATALRAWLAVRGEEPGALFLSRLNRRLSERTFRVMLAERGRRAGIPPRVHPHALRHACASHMHAGGADAFVIQELLRHRHISTTLIYTRVTRTRIRDTQKRCHPRG